MKKIINNQLKLYFTDLFPYKSSQNNDKFKYTVTLGIGGNIGNTKAIFHSLFKMLLSNNLYHIVKTSPLLLNPPFGFLEQNDFLNGIIVVKTNLPPMVILNQMQRYERRFKRKRSFKDAPRTLDIDIIFIKKHNINITLQTQKLILPHKDWQNRNSVIIPLSYFGTIKL